jgi:hypothetical protein
MNVVYECSQRDLQALVSVFCICSLLVYLLFLTALKADYSLDSIHYGKSGISMKFSWIKYRQLLYAFTRIAHSYFLQYEIFAVRFNPSFRFARQGTVVWIIVTLRLLSVHHKRPGLKLTTILIYLCRFEWDMITRSNCIAFKKMLGFFSSRQW